MPLRPEVIPRVEPLGEIVASRAFFTKEPHGRDGGCVCSTHTRHGRHCGRENSQDSGPKVRTIKPPAHNFTRTPMLKQVPSLVYTQFACPRNAPPRRAAPRPPTVRPPALHKFSGERARAPLRRPATRRSSHVFSPLLTIPRRLFLERPRRTPNSTGEVQIRAREFARAIPLRARQQQQATNNKQQARPTRPTTTTTTAARLQSREIV